MSELRDSFGRIISDLRISLTERCNYRCVYCRYGLDNAPGPDALSWEALRRLARVFTALGIHKIRLTGGEPLLRDGIEDYIAYLAGLRGPEGKPLDIALTTNGHLLAARAARLREAGLTRITVSLDSLKPEVFAEITRVRGGFERVMEGITAAAAAGLTPVKVNVVLMRGRNDGEIEDFARFARERALTVRFIEFMPLEQGKLWSKDLVVPYQEAVDRIARVYPIEALPVRGSETARRFRFTDGAPGEIGIIAPVSSPFCNQCSRIRLTADGQLRTCLFSLREWDLKQALEADDDAPLMELIRRAVWHKEERHHIGEPAFVKPARSMVRIGG
jgi:cyclic pyranopterin phosphate synthase